MNLKNISLFLFSVGIFVSAGYFSAGILFDNYNDNWEYRRLHPELLPSPESIRMTSAGHTTTSALISWISLIQYIGDNIGNGKYVDFTNKFIGNISSLHPTFEKPYHLALLLTPMINLENPDDKKTSEKQVIAAAARDIALKGIENTCDMDKVRRIFAFEPIESIWTHAELKNPCTDPQIVYALAYHFYNDFADKEHAYQYYKLASMHDAMPEGAKFLAIIMKSMQGSFKQAALSFFTIASESKDNPDNICQKLSSDMLRKTLPLSLPDIHLVEEFQEYRKELRPLQTKDAHAGYAMKCYDYSLRGLREIYLWYINSTIDDYEKRTSKTLEHFEEIEKAGILKNFPTPPDVDDGLKFILRKNTVNHLWQYTPKYK